MSEEIKLALELHEKWLTGNPDGKRMCLRGADLPRADLRYADLRGANLRYADLRGANLRGADLRGANLCYADLCYADLCYADLCYADLSGANLPDANLHGADLSGADLSDANLIGADLIGADLSGITADELTSGYWLVCPESGEFIGWKKAGQYILKLKIPADALRSSATTRKCRCSKAEVLEIQNMDGSQSELKTVESDYDSSFVYEIGKFAEVEDFSSDRWKECAPGIHFFISREEAVSYQ